MNLNYESLPRWLQIHIRASYIGAVVVAAAAIVFGFRQYVDPYHLLLAPIAVVIAVPRLIQVGHIFSRVQLPHLLLLGTWLIACGPSIVRYYLESRRDVLAYRRQRRNCCPRCGYDLRATRARCPECGFVPVRDDPRRPPT